MGFWPYFLQAHESDGGNVSPLLLDPSTSPIGTDTTLFCTPLLLFLGDGSKVLIMSSPEEGDSGPFSDMGSASSGLA